MFVLFVRAWSVGGRVQGSEVLLFVLHKWNIKLHHVCELTLCLLPNILTIRGCV